MLASCAFLVAGCGKGEPVNVLLIVMDTTRGDRCGFNGYDRGTTPNLDRFAEDAVVYRDAWSPAGWTGPAHASLFTGLRVENHGYFTGAQQFLGPVVPTMAELLAQAGWATACFSNNPMVSAEFGLTRGFGHVVPLHEDLERPYPWAPATHEAAADWAEARAREGVPFFLFVNDMEPHLRYVPGAEDERRLVREGTTGEEIAAGREFDFPRWMAYDARLEELSERELTVLSDLYDAEIAGLDRALGAFLDRLEAAGILDRTLVIVAGDHGEMMGEHHMLGHLHSLYRGVRHVPLLVRLPGRFDGGRAEDALVRLEDVLPTVLEVCGVAPPHGIDGVSLSRPLEGRVSVARQNEDRASRPKMKNALPALDPEPLTLGVSAIADGRWHLVLHDAGRAELYDLDADPLERRDLAAERPDEVARLAALLRAHR